MMLEKEAIQHYLSSDGWKNIIDHPEFKTKLKFDIIDEQKYWYSADFFLLIKEVDHMDKKTAVEIIDAFKTVEEKNPSFWQAKIILLYVIAKKVDTKVAKRLTLDEQDIREMNLNGLAGGRIYLVDLSKKQIHGKVPSTPFDARIKISEVKMTLEKALVTHLDYVTPITPRNFPQFWFKMLMIELSFFMLGCIAGIMIYQYFFR